MADSTETEKKDTNGDNGAVEDLKPGSEPADDIGQGKCDEDTEANVVEEVSSDANEVEKGGVEESEKVPVIKPAPQAQQDAELKPQDSLDGMEDCKLSPLDANAQRQSMKDALDGKQFPSPSLMDDALNAVKSTVNPKQDSHVHFSDNVENHQSSLHADDYTNHQNAPHNPNNHESALHSDPSSEEGAANNVLSKIRRKVPSLKPGQGKKSHSHPRKSPFRSEIAKLREQQRLEKEKKGISSKAVGIAVTTAPPDSASFVKQAEKVKHNILQSLGEFLTGAFADDEELSGSYFSQDLLDQISANDPTVKGIWLQAKSLTDNHVKQLCESLIRNKVVTEVWLPANQITDEGAGYIAHMLKFNQSIKELFLGKNEIGPKGAAALASALARGNNTLVALGLGDNHIGVEGAGAFAAALRHNHTLSALDIKNNDIPRHSSIRGLLHKMLEFNAADPGDESLVTGLQDELTSLISNLPPDMAEGIVLQAEEALKMAMLCRKRGDVVGAAEAEGIFIRICTTGEAPVDPPEELANAVRQHQKERPSKSNKKHPKKQKDPAELNDELKRLQYNEHGKQLRENAEEEDKTFEELSTEGGDKADERVSLQDANDGNDNWAGEKADDTPEGNAVEGADSGDSKDDKNTEKDH